MSAYRDSFNVTWRWDKSANGAGDVTIAADKMPDGSAPYGAGSSFTLPFVYASDAEVQNEVDRIVDEYTKAAGRAPLPIHQPPGKGAVLIVIGLLLVVFGGRRR